MKTLEFYSTPGHGYLKVPLQLLRELQISQLISGYSYIDNKDNVYCEEDCDMAIVCTRMKLDNIEFSIIEHYVDEDDDFLVNAYNAITNAIACNKCCEACSLYKLIQDKIAC